MTAKCSLNPSREGQNLLLNLPSHAYFSASPTLGQACPQDIDHVQKLCSFTATKVGCDTQNKVEALILAVKKCHNSCDVFPLKFQKMEISDKNVSSFRHTQYALEKTRYTMAN